MPPPASLVTLRPQTPWGWAATATQNIPSQECLLPLRLVTLTLLKGLHLGPSAPPVKRWGQDRLPSFASMTSGAIASSGTNVLAQDCPCKRQESSCWDHRCVRVASEMENYADVGGCLEFPPLSFTIWKWHLILGLGKFTVCLWWKKSFAPYAASLLYYVRKLMKAQILLFLCFGILWWSRCAMHSELSLRVYKEKRSSSESASDLQDKNENLQCLLLLNSWQARLHLLWGMKCFSFLMIK